MFWKSKNGGTVDDLVTATANPTEMEITQNKNPQAML
jgi:hypothetical protein